MKCLGIAELGGPEVLEVVELPDPQAGPGELRIRVHAAAVNPTDVAMRSGIGPYVQGLRDIPPPYVPGVDAAGIVDQIGDGASTDLAVGDPVMAIVLPSRKNGPYAQPLAAPPHSPLPRPSSP